MINCQLLYRNYIIKLWIFFLYRLFLYLNKPSRILSGDWEVVQNYIQNNVFSVCLSSEEQNALNCIRKCKTLDEVKEYRRKLFADEQDSDGVCFIRSALNQMYVTNYSANNEVL